MPSASGSIPSMEGSHVELKENTIIVVFGASGDLAKKKTFPALFGLFKKGLLPKNVHIIGYARTKMDDKSFKEREVSYIKNADDPEVKSKIDEFTSLSTYISGQYDQDDGFQNLEKHLAEIESKYDDKKASNNRIFYFALPPSVFIPVAQHVKRNNYTASGITRLIIEKPFGKDLDSCRELISAIKAEWSEDETFRIDHYLGKEMVKNILLFRFANVAINSGWDRNTISNVQISFKEPFGTEGRGGYFDEFGMIRDVLQNHLLQVLTVIAMERPLSFAAEDIRDEKTDVMKLCMSESNFDVQLVNDSIYEFYVRFKGPEETPFAGGVWRIHVELPDQYPYKSPSIGFMNKIFHPNIDEMSGSVCLDVINQTWSPMFDMVNIFEQFLPQLLRYPNPTDPLNGEAANLMMRDTKQYEAKVREYVQKFATKALADAARPRQRGFQPPSRSATTNASANGGISSSAPSSVPRNSNVDEEEEKEVEKEMGGGDDDDEEMEEMSDAGSFDEDD